MEPSDFELQIYAAMGLDPNAQLQDQPFVKALKPYWDAFANHWYAPNLPWAPVQPLDQMIEKQPTLLIGEAVFILLAFVALIHAFANGRQHVLLWFGALIGGCCNDVFFMVLPFVDNFWHAQCYLMLTPRLPAYILCVYIAFIYVPVAASWRLSKPPLFRFVAGALTAGLLYAPFDCVGAKHLWWTWHDTDAAVQERWLGVPIGSTMFTMMHTFCFHVLLHSFALGENRKLRAPTYLGCLRFLSSLIGISLLGTPFMMLAMTPCQLLQLKIGPDGQPTQLPGRPDLDALKLQLGLLGTAGVISWFGGLISGSKSSQRPSFLAKREQPSRLPLDRLLWLTAVLYFGALVGVMAFGSPQSVVAEGVHQQIGECYVHDVDLSNYSRYKYLCATDYEEDFSFDCAPQQNVTALKEPSWYTLCGKAHTDRQLYVQVVAGLGAAAALMLGIMLLPSRADAPAPPPAPFGKAKRA